MTNRIITPPNICKLAISTAISRHSTQLVVKSAAGEITHQAYLAEQFPADAISILEAAIDEAVQEYEERYKALLEEAKNAD